MATGEAAAEADATAAEGREVLLLLPLDREEPRPTREEREFRIEAAAEEDLGSVVNVRLLSNGWLYSVLEKSNVARVAKCQRGSSLDAATVMIYLLLI